ncbi:MAG: malate dehydrogenase [Paludibacteraceae bacterium]|nr:malate dehydrogenase [Paludibacteraceae bacterium]
MKVKVLTNKKLLLVGAGGAIGSNMAQTAAMLGLSSNICLYDIFEQGVHGVYEEMRHCGFDGVNFSYTTDAKEAFTDAEYIISSGGAPRKEGMTREDLLKGNAQIAADFADKVKQYCPNCKHIVVIFNPADITGLIVLVRSGLKPEQVTTLAGLDSTRLQSELANHFGIEQTEVAGCITLGGHGEKMVPVTSNVTVAGTPLTQLVGTDKLTNEQFEEIKQKTIQGGSNIIKLRGRSSFQSPAYVAVRMIEGAMGGVPFTLPAGCFVKDGMYGYKNVCMAMKSIIDESGVNYTEAKLSAEEKAALDASYKHLEAMRDEIISFGILPPVAEWNKINPNL